MPRELTEAERKVQDGVTQVSYTPLVQISVSQEGRIHVAHPDNMAPIDLVDLLAGAIRDVSTKARQTVAQRAAGNGVQ